MAELFPVAILGFDDFERSALVGAFRVSQRRDVGYTLADGLQDCRFAVVDSDRMSFLEAVRAARCLRRSVFIGPNVPVGAQAWLMRPLDMGKVLHELDMLAARESRETRPATLFGDLTGVPVPRRQVVPAPDGRPVRSDALGRRHGDTLGGVPQSRRSDRRS